MLNCLTCLVFTRPLFASGWTYDLQGRLRKATRLKGIKDFKASENGLVPLHVDTWGPFVFVNASKGAVPPLEQWLGGGGQRVRQQEGLGRVNYNLLLILKSRGVFLCHLSHGTRGTAASG